MTRARLQKARAVLDQRQPDLTVLLENVHKPHNTSAIIRTCDAVGVLEAFAVVRAGTLVPATATASSAEKWVRIHVERDVQAAAAEIKRRGMRIAAAHLSPSAIDYRSFDYTQPCAILLGQELGGVTGEGLAVADTQIVIPMRGLVASLNVSVAAAVILFEAERQRRAAGMYDACRLDPVTYQRLLFEWLHPDIAEIYRQRGEPYPPIDEDGDLRPSGWTGPGVID